jgi:hypothetical protein
MIEFEKTYPIVRVYFNRKEDFPNVWSVDDGNQTNEIIVPRVISQGVSRFVWNGITQSSEVSVRAWVEFNSARLHRTDQSDEIFIENSST